MDKEDIVKKEFLKRIEEEKKEHKIFAKSRSKSNMQKKPKGFDIEVKSREFAAQKREIEQYVKTGLGKGKDLTNDVIIRAYLNKRRGDVNTGIDLSGANLRGAKLEGSHFIQTNLEGADLYGSNLEGTDLRYCNLNGAKMNGLDLRNTKFNEFTTLKGSNLLQTNLSKVDLRDIDMYGSCLSGANLSGANLEGADLSGADLEGADLTDANLRNTQGV